MSDIVHSQTEAVSHQLATPSLFGGVKMSRGAVAQVRRQVEQAVVDQFAIERAKQAAVAGMLAEHQVQQLGNSLWGEGPEGQLAAAPYVSAIRTASLTRVIRAGGL